MSQYRRIIVDDSSSDNNDDSDDDDNNGNNDKFIDKTQEDESSESEENMDASIRDVSHLLETISFRKRNTYGQRVDRTDDEETSNDEDTYLEDSFVVKDHTSSEGIFPENSNSSIISSNNESKEEEQKSTSSYHRKQGKAMKKKTNRKIGEFSSFFKSDLSDSSIDDNKIFTLLELYPELKENVDPTSIKSNSDNSERNNESIKCNIDNDDEKFEKYLEQVKVQQSATKIYGTGDLNGFIMDDSESITECSSESETSLKSDESDNGQLIPSILKNDDNDDWRNQNHIMIKRINNERTMLPATEKKRKRKEIANLLWASRSDPIIQPTNLRDDDEVFLLALSPNGPVHSDAQKYITAKFPRIREELTKTLYDLYRIRCFEDKLDPNMMLEWNARLRLTAGRCRCKSDGTASIELSIKVCDSPERLRDTLLHELCHAAVWVIDCIRNGGHGPAWKYWVYRCQEVFPSLPLIERCHNYKIDAKYLYICDRCGQIIKRHSKSLDVERKICGICQGHFFLRTRDGKSTRPANTFAQFVKENYGKERKPGLKHAETMKILSERFKKEKGTVPGTEESCNLNI